MHMEWADLCFAHWRWDPVEVAARLPAGLALDTYDGVAWLGVVPFRMNAVKPLGLPLPFGRGDFLELNLRTYVRDRKGRPGVWFFSLDCTDAAAVAGAHIGFGLPYRRATLAASPAVPNGPVAYAGRTQGGDVHYCWQRNSDWRAAAGDPLENFLLERYRLFSQRGRELVTGMVEHAPYRIADASLRIDSAASFTSNGFTEPTSPPDHVAVAQTVQVRASAPVRA